jgi:hypothetical protein
MRATKRQPSALTPSTSRRNRPPRRRATQAPVMLRANRNAIVAPSVAPSRFHSVPQAGPKRAPPAKLRSAPEKNRAVPAA